MCDSAKKACSSTDKTNEKRRGILDKAQSGVYEVSFTGDKFISVDDYVCKSLGFCRDELLSMNPLELLDSESLDKFGELLLKEELNEGHDTSAKFRVKTKDGRFKTFIAHLIELKNKDGFPSSAVVLATDVTEDEKASD